LDILILGIDGYIGWPLAKYLRELGHNVSGVDNFSRRRLSSGLFDIESIEDRQKEFPIEKCYIEELKHIDADVVIHLAEQPSASWSMSKYGSITTQRHNVLGTLNLLWLLKDNPTHLIKLGTMGEYGTPDCDIPEGFIESGEMKGMMFPRKPGSFYHLSKVFDSMNVEFACRMWGLDSTDIMQGVVFGVGGRLDYDEHFGTVLNRFCIQAINGDLLTVYGDGGQTRGYLPIEDSIECLTLAIDNPADGYRVFNQFAKTYSVNELADIVINCAKDLGIYAHKTNINNPRIEEEEHYYNPKHDKLAELGYNPTWDIKYKVLNLLKFVSKYKKNIRTSLPKTNWK